VTIPFTPSAARSLLRLLFLPSRLRPNRSRDPALHRLLITLSGWRRTGLRSSLAELWVVYAIARAVSLSHPPLLLSPVDFPFSFLTFVLERIGTHTCGSAQSSGCQNPVRFLCGPLGPYGHPDAFIFPPPPLQRALPPLYRHTVPGVPMMPRSTLRAPTTPGPLGLLCPAQRFVGLLPFPTRLKFFAQCLVSYSPLFPVHSPFLSLKALYYRRGLTFLAAIPKNAVNDPSRTVLRF